METRPGRRSPSSPQPPCVRRPGSSQTRSRRDFKGVSLGRPDCPHHGLLVMDSNPGSGCSPLPLPAGPQVGLEVPTLWSRLSFLASSRRPPPPGCRGTVQSHVVGRGSHWWDWAGGGGQRALRTCQRSGRSESFGSSAPGAEAETRFPGHADAQPAREQSGGGREGGRSEGIPPAPRTMLPLAAAGLLSRCSLDSFRPPGLRSCLQRRLFRGGGRAATPTQARAEADRLGVAAAARPGQGRGDSAGSTAGRDWKARRPLLPLKRAPRVGVAGEDRNSAHCRGAR